MSTATVPQRTRGDNFGTIAYLSEFKASSYTLMRGGELTVICVIHQQINALLSGIKLRCAGLHPADILSLLPAPRGNKS
jgi:hypothetical protein